MESKKKFNPMLWLDRLSWPGLLIIAVLLAIVPITPEPHLVEKLRMLFQGTLSRPIDIFDLLMHSAPLILITIKGYRQFRKRK